MYTLYYRNAEVNIKENEPHVYMYTLNIESRCLNQLERLCGARMCALESMRRKSQHKTAPSHSTLSGSGWHRLVVDDETYPLLVVVRARANNFREDFAGRLFDGGPCCCFCYCDGRQIARVNTV